MALSTKKAQAKAATRPPAPEAPRPAVKATARVGIEVDGPTVHAVTVSSRGVVTLRTFEGESPAAALEVALKAVPRGDIDRVAWTGGRQNLRRLDVPNVPSRAMRAAITTIAEESLPIVPGATAIAALDLGLADPLDPSGPRSMIVAAVESMDLDPVWRRLGGRRAPITASAFLVATDGLYLHAAYSTSELVLVRDGAPVAVRTLRTGGVGALLARVNEGSDSPVRGLDGLAHAIANPFTGDGSAIDAFLEELVDDVRRTVVFWRREGLHVEDTIHVVGTGAALPTLTQRLRDASYLPMPAELPAHLDLSDLDDIERTVAYPALMAAISDLAEQPHATLPNPVYEDKKARDKAKARRARTIVAALVAVGVTAAVVVVPWLGVQAQLAKARYDQGQAEDAAAAVAPALALRNRVEAGEKTIAEARATQPPWTVLLSRISTAAPDGAFVLVSSISLATDGTTVTGQFKGAVQASSNASLSAWIEALAAVGIQARPGAYEFDGAVVSTTFTFSMPVDALAVEEGA